MKHTKSIFVFAFSTLIIFTACSHKSTPTVAAAPQQTSAQINMMTVSSPAVAEGEKTYNAKCGRCHELKSPSEFTVKDWNSIMRSMAPKAKLTEEERTNVMAYVVQNARGK